MTSTRSETVHRASEDQRCRQENENKNCMKDLKEQKQMLLPAEVGPTEEEKGRKGKKVLVMANHKG